MKKVFASFVILLLATAVWAQQNDQTVARTRGPQGDAATEPAVTADAAGSDRSPRFARQHRLSVLRCSQKLGAAGFARGRARRW